MVGSDLRAAQNCVLTVALWRRFGTVHFMDRLGFVLMPETTSDMLRLGERILDIACALWREGQHACTDAYEPASHCNNLEIIAWLDGKLPQDGAEGESPDSRQRAYFAAQAGQTASFDLQCMRKTLATQARERYVRYAYSTFLLGESWPLQDLCKSCEAVATVLVSTGRQSWQRATEELMRFKGYRDRRWHAAEVIRDLSCTPFLDKCMDLDDYAAPVSSLTQQCLGRLKRVRDSDMEPTPSELRDQIVDIYRERQRWPDTILKQSVERLDLPDVQAQLGEFERYLQAREGLPQRAPFHPRIPDFVFSASKS